MDFSGRKVVNLKEHEAAPSSIDNDVDGILREMLERRADPKSPTTHRATGIFAIVVNNEEGVFDFTYYCAGLKTSVAVALLEAAKTKLVKHLICDDEG